MTTSRLNAYLAAFVDATLHLFDDGRTRARRSYTRMLRGQREQAWIGEDPVKAPWWRGQGEVVDDGAWEGQAGSAVAHAGPGAKDLDARSFLRRAAKAMGVEVEVLASARKTQEVGRAREAIAVVGVERVGIGVGELANALGKHPGSVSRWIIRAGSRRRDDPAFASRCLELEKALLRL